MNPSNPLVRPTCSRVYKTVIQLEPESKGHHQESKALASGISAQTNSLPIVQVGLVNARFTSGRPPLRLVIAGLLRRAHFCETSP